MYATLVRIAEDLWRSSFFQTKEEAIAYAERMPGVEAVEEIGGERIWTRKPQ